jgi:hypothetical protein
MVLGLSLATNVSRLTGVHRQIAEVTEIERIELRFRNRLPVSLVSRRIDYGHGQDVGIEVHMFVFLSFRIVTF